MKVFDRVVALEVDFTALESKLAEVELVGVARESKYKLTATMIANVAAKLAEVEKRTRPLDCIHGWTPLRLPDGSWRQDCPRCPGGEITGDLGGPLPDPTPPVSSAAQERCAYRYAKFQCGTRREDPVHNPGGGYLEQHAFVPPAPPAECSWCGCRWIDKYDGTPSTFAPCARHRARGGDMTSGRGSSWGRAYGQQSSPAPPSPPPASLEQEQKDWNLRAFAKTPVEKQSPSQARAGPRRWTLQLTGVEMVAVVGPWLKEGERAEVIEATPAVLDAIQKGDKAAEAAKRVEKLIARWRVSSRLETHNVLDDIRAALAGEKP